MLARLPLFLAICWSVLIVYGSLYPLSGWRDSGAPPLAFLGAGWPRWYTGFDLVVNVLAYLPLGFLWLTALLPRLTTYGRYWQPTVNGTVMVPAISWATLSWRGALASVTLGCALLSLGIEISQNYLPSRVSSNLDLAMNTLGALFGALLGLRWGALLLDGSRLALRRARYVQPGIWGDAGLLLLGLWLLTQFDPATLLFGNGDLRDLLALPTPFTFSSERAVWLEGAAVAAQTLVIALLLACLLRRRLWWPVLGLLLLALLCKSAATWLMMQGRLAFAWATPGSLGGLALGLLLWVAASPLRPSVQRALAVLALLIAVLLVNATPENPYFAHTLQLWRPGHFLNFHGLTRLVVLLWPYLALVWLLSLPMEKER